MTVRVTCPNPGCGKVAEVDEQSLGRRGRCKKCGHVFALARPDGKPDSATSNDASAWKKDTAPATPSSLPEQFGRYRIMKTLGQGGMGAVYLAHDTKLDRQVALKVPYFHPSEGPEAVQRFKREARAAATLDHPNLCRIFDVGEVDGIHYLTMPFIQGKTLADALSKDQTFTEAQAAAVIRKLALALQEAHEKGVVHRDLKPANIMIKKGRDLVIMDFGLARMAGGEEGITRTGHVLGTALYMAPEQAAGDLATLGPPADVYALGIILHELLTGRRPFEGPWSLVIGLKSVKDPEPPSKHRPDLGPALDAICLKAIAKDPADRYQTMAEFGDALNKFLAAPTSTPSEESQTSASAESLAARIFSGIITQDSTLTSIRNPTDRPKLEGAKNPSPRSPGRPGIIAVACAVAFLLVGIVYVATNKGRIKIKVNDPNSQVFVDGRPIPVGSLDEPITLGAGEHDLTVKRGDVEVEARKFVVRRGDNPALPVAPVLAVKEATPPPAATPPDFLKPLSKEGNPWPAASALVGQTLATQGHIFATSRDGRFLAQQTQANSLRIVDLADPGKPIEGLKHDDPPFAEGRIWKAAFSSDGKYLASCGDFGIVRIWDVATGKEVHRLSHKESCRIVSVAFSQDGRRLASVGHAENSIKVWDVSSGQLIGKYASLADYPFSAAISPDGRWLASGGGPWDAQKSPGELKVWSIDTGKFTTLEGHPKRVAALAFSPDGRYLASGSHDRTVKLWDPRSYRCLGTFDKHAGDITGIRFSRDGLMVVSAANDGSVRVWEASTGREVANLGGKFEGTNFIEISASGQWVLTAFRNILKSWEMPGKK
jgi:serine/threonine protein kinase/WD40 repeat protein